MLFKIKLFTTLIIILFTKSLFADAELRINDTTLAKGVEHRIDLIGTIPEVNGQLAIKIKYNALLLDIKEVEGSIDHAIKEDNPEFINNMSELENSVLIVNSNNYTNVNNSKICTIVLEALAGPDSLAVMEPLELTINDKEPEGTIYISGTFFIGSPIFEKYKESMSYVRPNPFNSSTVIPFTLSKESNVEFRIFTMGGRLVDKLPGSTLSKYMLIDESKKEINLKIEERLPKGSYSLSYTPDRWELSQGVYYIVMKGSQGTYLRTMMYIR